MLKAQARASGWRWLFKRVQRPLLSETFSYRDASEPLTALMMQKFKSFRRAVVCSQPWLHHHLEGTQCPYLQWCNSVIKQGKVQAAGHSPCILLGSLGNFVPIAIALPSSKHRKAAIKHHSWPRLGR